MKSVLMILPIFFILSCNQTDLSISSPSNINHMEFYLDDFGYPYYEVFHNNDAVIKPSSFGFEFTNMKEMTSGFKIDKTEKNAHNEIWELPWGERQFVEDKHNELKVYLSEIGEAKRKFNLILRAYDDGVAFRYEFPKQNNLDTILIKEEKTYFNLTGDHTCWWIPGDWDIYEHLYSTTKLSKINALKYRNHNSLAQSYIPENSVSTPITMRTKDGLHLSFHEANLTNYSGMTLKINTEALSMRSSLVGSENHSYRVKRALPFKTPWRTIQIGKTAGALIESNLILNLNEPNKIGDVSWFKPLKYVGIWWEMHLGKSGWDLAGGKHGATTANAKKHIDFAAENNIDAVLIEGWNTGWEHWIGFEDREGVFDFTTPYPDYDLEEVVRYAKGKNVQIIMHHETSSAVTTYETRMDAAFDLMNQYDIRAVKTGYVGKIIPKGEYHHGQYMVKHYRKVLEKSAKKKIAVNAHEPIKATGIRRTYPNAVSREGLRGQEFNAWASDGGNPPEHLPIVAFTRMLAGPIDFTPGAFNIKLKPYKDKNQINTTLAQQLALYVVIYSPIQMACDLLEYYENHPAFQFIRDVGVDWQETKVLNGEIGDFVTIARKERNSENWFLGAVTDENGRTIKIDFSFLNKNKKYKAKIYKDGATAHWNDNPLDIQISERIITSKVVKDFYLAPGGGLAISLVVVK
jgi:hypothetical protein